MAAGIPSCLSYQELWQHLPNQAGHQSPPSRPEAQNSVGTWTTCCLNPGLILQQSRLGISQAQQLEASDALLEVFGEERACVTFCSVSGFYSHPGEVVSIRCLQMLPHDLRVEEDTLMTPPEPLGWNLLPSE